jgi:hypothetical protein
VSFWLASTASARQIPTVIDQGGKTYIAFTAAQADTLKGKLEVAKATQISLYEADTTIMEQNKLIYMMGSQAQIDSLRMDQYERQMEDYDAILEHYRKTHKPAQFLKFKEVWVFTGMLLMWLAVRAGNAA